MPVILVRKPAGIQLALLGLFALAVRLVYILLVAPAPVGVGGDAGFYHSAANLIGHGRILYREIFGHAYVTAEHPPLFPLVLAVVSVFGGESLVSHRIAGCVIGSLAVVLIALLAREAVAAQPGEGDSGQVCAGEAQRARAAGRAARMAGGLAAIYPPLVTADGLVMSEPLFVLGVAAALLAAIRLRAHPSLRMAVVLGGLIGLCTLTRGEGAALLILLGWPAACVAGSPRTGRWPRIAAVTLASVLVVSPWIIRNLVVFGRPTLAADANTVLAGANCRQTYYGRDIGWWSNRCLERARTRTQLLHGDASTGRAVRYAGAHALRLPLVAVVRVLRTFDLFQPMRQGNRELRRQWVDVAGLAFFYPLLVLAVVGFLRLRRLRLELLAPVVMTLVVSLLGWGIGRFRVAADISLLVLAASALGAGRVRRS